MSTRGRRTKLWVRTPQVTNVLGMQLMDPTPELLEVLGLDRAAAGPVVLDVADPSIFMHDEVTGRSTAPGPGCMFWVITQAAFPFAEGTAYSDRHRLTTVRDLVGGLFQHALSPKEFIRALQDAETRMRERAKALHGTQRRRMLALARGLSPSREDSGQHICGIVYAYPHSKGTMTTYFRLLPQHLRALRRCAISIGA